MNDKKNEKYYNLSNALEDFADAYGAKDKAISGLKLLGKGLFNVAKYAATDGAVAVAESAKNKSENALKRDNLTDEQREKYEDLNRKSSEFLATRKKEE